MKQSALLLVVYFFVGATSSFGQWTPGTYMRQATERAFNRASSVESSSDTYGLLDGSCFFGAILDASGGASEMNFYLEEGTSYKILGGGDNDATDIDITIKNSEGSTVASDVEKDNFPIANFKPYKSGTYTIRLSNHSTTLVYAAFVILKSGGYTINKSNVTDAIDKIFSLCTNVNNKDDRSISFLRVKNQWCFYGYFIPEGTSRSVTNIDLGGDFHYLVGAGDTRATDIDLCLKNSDASEKVSCDTESDAIPIVSYTTSSSNKYALEVKNVASTGKCIVFVSVLTARK